jgi:hypothetical protein
MAGIGKYTKGKKFTLKSGNAPEFKMMGSSEESPNKFFYGRKDKMVSALKEGVYDAARFKTDKPGKDTKEGMEQEMTKDEKRWAEMGAKLDSAVTYNDSPNKDEDDDTGGESGTSGSESGTSGSENDNDDKDNDDDKDKDDGDSKAKKIGKKATGVLVGAITGGLDAVYGTGKVQPNPETVVISDKDKEKIESETAQEVLDDNTSTSQIKQSGDTGNNNDENDEEEKEEKKVV